MILRSSSSISKTDELADDLFEEFFCWLSDQQSCCAAHIQKARDYLCNEEFELNELHKLSAIEFEQLNIEKKTCEMIQDDLRDSEWKKHARDFIRLQAAESSTVFNNSDDDEIK